MTTTRDDTDFKSEFCAQKRMVVERKAKKSKSCITRNY